MNQERTGKMITDRSLRMTAMTAASYCMATAIALAVSAVPAAPASAADALAARQPTPPTCDDIRRQVRRDTLRAWLRMELEASGEVTAVTCSELRASPVRAAAPAPRLDFELADGPEHFPRTLCPECRANTGPGALHGSAGLWPAAPFAPGLVAAAASQANTSAFSAAAPDVGITDIKLEFVQIIQDELQVTQSITLDPQFVDALASGGQHDLYVPVYVHPAPTEAWLRGTIEDTGETSGVTYDPVTVE
jgi:hypothetical protein